MLRQYHLAEAALPQLFQDDILPKAAARIELLAFGGVQRGLVLHVLQVVIGELATLRVEQAQFAVADLPADVRQGGLLTAKL